MPASLHRKTGFALAALVFCASPLSLAAEATAPDADACAASFKGDGLGEALGLAKGAVQVVDRDGRAWAAGGLAAALSREGYAVELVAGELPEAARTGQQVVVKAADFTEAGEDRARIALLEGPGADKVLSVRCGEVPTATFKVAGVLGVLKASDEESANIFGVGGLGLRGEGEQALGGLVGTVIDDRQARQQKIDAYLGEMLWLNETRVALADGSVQRVYDFAEGRDKRPIDLNELLTISGEAELLEKAESRQAKTFWLASLPAYTGAGLMGLGLTVMLGDMALMIADVPDDIVSPVLYGSFVVMGAGLAVWTGGMIAAIIIGSPEQDVPEHELRRIVRQHNERLRAEHGIEAYRDEIPSGVPE